VVVLAMVLLLVLVVLALFILDTGLHNE